MISCMRKLETSVCVRSRRRSMFRASKYGSVRMHAETASGAAERRTRSRSQSVDQHE